MESVPESPQPLYCSFCGKTEEQVAGLIAGPSVFICNECVELCNDIIERRFVPGTLNEKMAERREKGKA